MMIMDIRMIGLKKEYIQTMPLKLRSRATINTLPATIMPDAIFHVPVALRNWYNAYIAAVIRRISRDTRQLSISLIAAIWS